MGGPLHRIICKTNQHYVMTVKFISAKHLKGTSTEGKDYDFTIAKVQTDFSIIKVMIDNADVDYYERGKAYFLGTSTDRKGTITYELGLEVE